MRKSLLPILACPACWSALDAKADREEGGHFLDGQLSCKGCGRRYPVKEGAPYLAVLDENWGTILKELINRREIILQNILRPLDKEEDNPRDERKAREEATLVPLTDTCFREAMKRLPEGGALRILDCGAGMFETSEALAGAGHEVVATETELSLVRFANHEGPEGGDPQPFDLNGRTYHVRRPEPHGAYFDRLAADIQRLPFAAASFDVAFCRAMLHHVDNLRGALTEMARVVRPGGMILICAEPIRSILDPEEEYNATALDREEGMNEQAPHLLAYRRSLKPWADPIAIQYWPFPGASRTRRLFSLLHYDYTRHLHPGQVIEDWRWMKLLPTAAATNWMATRNEAPADPPAPITDSSVATVEEAARIYWRYDSEKDLGGFIRGNEDLRALRRSILERNPHRFPISIQPGTTDSLLLESGWGPKVIHRERAGRYTLHRASVVLSCSSHAKALNISFSGGHDGARCRSRVLLNGEPAGTLEVGGREGWTERSLPLRGIKRRVLHVEILNDVLTPEPATGIPAGVAIRDLEVV